MAWNVRPQRRLVSFYFMLPWSVRPFITIAANWFTLKRGTTAEWVWFWTKAIKQINRDIFINASTIKSFQCSAEIKSQICWNEHVKFHWADKYKRNVHIHAKKLLTCSLWSKVFVEVCRFFPRCFAGDKVERSVVVCVKRRENDALPCLVVPCLNSLRFLELFAETENNCFSVVKT